MVELSIGKAVLFIGVGSNFRLGGHLHWRSCVGVTSYQLLLFSKTSGKRQDPAGLLTVAQVIMFRTDMSKSGGGTCPRAPVLPTPMLLILRDSLSSASPLSGLPFLTIHSPNSCKAAKNTNPTCQSHCTTFAHNTVTQYL